jgi:hypothetical protein
MDLMAHGAVGQVQLVGGARVILVAHGSFEHAERAQWRQALPRIHRLRSFKECWRNCRTKKKPLR